jgi:hypothetical protein
MRAYFVTGKYCRLALLSGAAVLAAGSTGASARERSHVLAYAAMLDPDGSLQTRSYQGAFVSIYTEANVGLHADVVHVDREENATFLSGGVSIPLNEHVRPRLMIGTSTDNRAILPDLYSSLSVEIKPGHNSGWIVTPGVAYRHYRNGFSETIGSLGVVRYFVGPWDQGGYYAAQVTVSGSVSSNDNVRGSISAGIQTVRRSGVIIGINAEGGTLVSDPARASEFRGRYFALHPNISVPVVPNLSIIARGEYVDAELYDALGGLTGIKVEF